MYTLASVKLFVAENPNLVSKQEAVGIIERATAAANESGIISACEMPEIIIPGIQILWAFFEAADTPEYFRASLEAIREAAASLA